MTKSVSSLSRAVLCPLSRTSTPSPSLSSSISCLCLLSPALYPSSLYWELGLGVSWANTGPFDLYFQLGTPNLQRDRVICLKFPQQGINRIRTELRKLGSQPCLQELVPLLSVPFRDYELCLVGICLLLQCPLCVSVAWFLVLGMCSWKRC